MLPDIELFKVGIGEAICRRLLHKSDAHSQMPLLTRALYVQDDKAEVLLSFDRKPASETPWTPELRINDLVTKEHFAPKTNPPARAHLDNFVACYRADDRTQRAEAERFRRFAYDALTQRDKANLNISWLHDESLEDTENLPPSEQISVEIMEDLRAVLG